MFFKYKAVKDNKIIINQIQAENQESVLRYLKSSGYFPVSISRIDNPQISFFNMIFKRISFDDTVDFTRQLGIMLNAGLTLVEALEILKKQISKPAILEMLESIDKEIKGGGNFSSALTKFPQYFSSFYISLVKSGEASGKLAEVLLKLSDNLEKEREFRAKITSALIYPVFVITAMIIVAFIMITFVVPKLTDMFKDFNVSLPLSTRILMFLGNISSHYWPFIVVSAIAGIYFLVRYIRTKHGRYLLDSFSLKLPVIGNVIKMSVLVDSTRTLSVLLESGVSLIEALDLTVDATPNVIYQNAFTIIRKQVEKGTSLGNAMKEQEIFPPILVQMAMVGEETGHIDETLSRISRYFQMESELAIKAMTTLIEPIILVVLGIGVGFLVYSIIIPIYNLTASFK